MALVSIGTEEALNSINRKTLREYLLAMKQKDGSFRVHKDGEVDIRGAYCALAVASITNMLDEEISSNVE
ncbi:unnamed protein product, partial [Anisakis simplex]|uniref:Protein farnesyltransferase subunit beta n=1 Tax=Anisakis simplex TaxID=6269 RepID=A0A0M3JQB9_ANISI